MAGRLAALATLLVAAFAVFLLSVRTPAPEHAGPASAGFCEPCAMRLVQTLGAQPHPVGSAAHALARDAVLAQMNELGLSPRVQRAQARRTWAFGRSERVIIAPVENIVGRLPGRDPSLPGLLLMAHYDSVPGSPGAADDAAGVAVALDAVRAVRMRGQPLRDVVVAITDGEEEGLLGAQAFFGDDPQARRIGFVINADVRGGGGRALMFQTSDDDAGEIDLLRRTERAPNATSLLPFAYRYLPNDTDFTVARDAGRDGLNFAFIGRQFDYHSPSSTPAALDQGALQDLGEAVGAPAAALAFAPDLPRHGRDVVFFDLLGLELLAYPQAWGWAGVALAVLLVFAGALRAAAQEPLDAAGVLRGVVGGIGALLAPALALAAVQAVAGNAAGDLRPILARFALFEAAALLAGLAGLLAAAAAPSRRDRAAEGWLGVLAAGLVVAVAAQALAPLAAFVVIWPLTAASLAFLLLSGVGAASRWSWTAYAVVGVLALAWIGVLMHELLQGLDLALAAAPCVWLAALVVWPLTRAPGSGRLVSLAAAAVLLAFALGGAAWLRWADPWSPRHPQAVQPLLITAPDGRTWRAAPAGEDPWTDRFLGPGRRMRFPVIPGARAPLAATPAGRRAPPIGVSVRRLGGGVEVEAPPSPPGATLDLDLAATGRLADVQVQGAPVAWRGGEGARLRLTLIGPGRPLQVRLVPVGRGTLAVRWSLWRPGWPPDVPPPPKTDRTMFWDRSPAVVEIGERAVSW